MDPKRSGCYCKGFFLWVEHRWFMPMSVSQELVVERAATEGKQNLGKSAPAWIISRACRKRL